MPELSISEDQREYIESLRADLAEDAGPYGHVRPRDALQFLIDSHEEEGTSVDAITEETETQREEETDKGSEKSEASDETESDGDDDGNDDENNGNESADGSDDADRLSSMMSLLDEHDGKWRRLEDDGTYEVDLPEGDTESVRTKDEVRAVLFKQY